MYNLQIDETNLDFQLKKHTLTNFLQSKTQEIQFYEKNLSLHSSPIQDQNQIIQLIKEVKSNLKNIDKMFSQLKTVFNELELTFVLSFFHEMMYCLMQGVMLLANSCQQGVENNLMKFQALRSKNNENQTQCLKITNEDVLKELEQSNRKSNDFYSDIRTKMEIERIYSTLLIDKHSISGIVSSSAPHRLEEIEESLNWLVDQTDKVIEDGMKKRREQQKLDPGNKIHNTEEINKMFKAQMSDNIRKCFHEKMGKISKKIKEDFRKNEYEKLREQILKLKVKTSSFGVQTDPEMKRKESSSTLKDKKIVERLQRQLRDAEAEKDEIIDKYLKLLKSSNNSNQNKNNSDQERSQPNQKKRESISARVDNRRSSRLFSSRITNRQSINLLLPPQNQNQPSHQPKTDTNTHNTQSKINIEFQQRKSIFKERTNHRKQKIRVTKTHFFNQSAEEPHKSRFQVQNKSILRQNKLQSSSDSDKSLHSECYEAEFQDQINEETSQKPPFINFISSSSDNNSNQRNSSSTNAANSQLKLSLEISKVKSSQFQQHYKQVIDNMVGIIDKSKKLKSRNKDNNIYQNQELQSLFETTLVQIINDSSSKLQIIPEQGGKQNERMVRSEDAENDKNEKMGKSGKTKNRVNQQEKTSDLSRNFNIIFKVLTNIRDTAEKNPNKSKNNLKLAGDRTSNPTSIRIHQSEKNRFSKNKQNSGRSLQRMLIDDLGRCKPIEEEILQSKNLIGDHCYHSITDFQKNQSMDKPLPKKQLTLQTNICSSQYNRFDRFRGDLAHLKHRIKDKYIDRKIYTESSAPLTIQSHPLKKRAINKISLRSQQPKQTKEHLLKISSIKQENIQESRTSKSLQPLIDCFLRVVKSELLIKRGIDIEQSLEVLRGRMRQSLGEELKELRGTDLIA